MENYKSLFDVPYQRRAQCFDILMRGAGTRDITWANLHDICVLVLSPTRVYPPRVHYAAVENQKRGSTILYSSLEALQLYNISFL